MLFDVFNVNELTEILNSEIDAPVVHAYKSTLGGDRNVSIIMTISLDPRDTWTNGILENSRHFRMSLDNDGTLEQFTRSEREHKKFRKTKVKSWDDTVEKINKYIREVR